MRGKATALINTQLARAHDDRASYACSARRQQWTFPRSRPIGNQTCLAVRWPVIPTKMTLGAPWAVVKRYHPKSMEILEESFLDFPDAAEYEQQTIFLRTP